MNKKAIRRYEFDGPEVLRFDETPQPEPTDDQVLIKVHAAGVNPVERIQFKSQKSEIRRQTSANHARLANSSIVVHSARVRKSFAAATFSSKCARDAVPEIGSMTGER